MAKQKKDNQETILTECPKMGAIVDADKVKFASRTFTRKSVYTPLFEKMAGLSPKQGFKIDVPAGISIKTLQNRLGAGRRRKQKEADKSNTGVEFYFAQTEDTPPKLFVGAREKPKAK